MPDLKNILSLGAGIQSSAVLLMSCAGILPKLDAVGFSDTEWESRKLYLQLEYLKDRARYAGIAFYTTGAGSLRNDSLNRESDDDRVASMPVYVKNADGSCGMIARQCTKEYKIEPITTLLRGLIGLDAGERFKGNHPAINLWLGISSDERSRMKVADRKWKRNVYPLCNWPDTMLSRPWSRYDCRVWLETNHPEIDWVSSGCIGCPYRSDEDWRDMKLYNPDDFADAVEFDYALRDPARKQWTIAGKLKGEAYLHDSLIPLGEIDFRNAEDLGQRNWTKECAGICGV